MAQWTACWAHNPEVPGSRPGSATLLLISWTDGVMVTSRRRRIRVLACKWLHGVRVIILRCLRREGGSSPPVAALTPWRKQQTRRVQGPVPSGVQVRVLLELLVRVGGGRPAPCYGVPLCGLQVRILSEPSHLEVYRMHARLQIERQLVRLQPWCLKASGWCRPRSDKASEGVQFLPGLLGAQARAQSRSSNASARSHGGRELPLWSKGS